MSYVHGCYELHRHRVCMLYVTIGDCLVNSWANDGVSAYIYYLTWLLTASYCVVLHSFAYMFVIVCVHISVQYHAYSYMYMRDSVHISLPREVETPEYTPHIPLCPRAFSLQVRKFGSQIWPQTLVEIVATQQLLKGLLGLSSILGPGWRIWESNGWPNMTQGHFHVRVALGV